MLLPVCSPKTNCMTKYLSTSTFIQVQTPLMSSSSRPKILAQAVGRRKEAVALVYLTAGPAEMIVNTKPISEYFPGVRAQIKFQSPFQALSLPKPYTATIKVHGGGLSGQLDAVVLGLSRA